MIFKECKKYNELRTKARYVREAAQTAKAVADGSAPALLTHEYAITRALFRAQFLLAAREDDVIQTVVAAGSCMPTLPSVNNPLSRVYTCAGSVILARTNDPLRGLWVDSNLWNTEPLVDFVRQAAEQAWNDVAVALEAEAQAAEDEFEAFCSGLVGPPKTMLLSALTGGDAIHHVVVLGGQKLEWIEARWRSLAEEVLRGKGYGARRHVRVDRQLDGTLQLVHGDSTYLDGKYSVIDPNADYAALREAIREAYRARNERMALEPIKTSTEL
jgi:hypothetical protein